MRGCGCGHAGTPMFVVLTDPRTGLLPPGLRAPPDAAWLSLPGEPRLRGGEAASRETAFIESLARGGDEADDEAVLAPSSIHAAFTSRGKLQPRGESVVASPPTLRASRPAISLFADLLPAP